MRQLLPHPKQLACVVRRSDRALKLGGQPNCPLHQLRICGLHAASEIQVVLQPCANMASG